MVVYSTMKPFRLLKQDLRLKREVELPVGSALVRIDERGQALLCDNERRTLRSAATLHALFEIYSLNADCFEKPTVVSAALAATS
jgi:hypothetical protein